MSTTTSTTQLYQNSSAFATTSAAASGTAMDVSRAVQLISYAQLITISAIGSIGNSVVLYVYSQKKDRQTANVFIISLATSDMIACTLVIPMTLGMELVGFRTHLTICKLYYLVNASGIPFSCMLMSAIAVDRYFCICRPFLRAITIPRAKAIVLCLGALAVTLGLTTAAFCSGVVAQTGPNGTWQYDYHGECKEVNDISKLNASSLQVSHASLAFYHVFQKVHVSLFGICILLVVTLYVCIYRSVLAMRRKRRELKGKQRLNNARKSTAGEEVAEVAEEAEPLAEGDDGARRAADEAVAVSSASIQLHQMPMKKRRRSVLPTIDGDALQNLKTAAMLFVVTIVFACTFVPAALMSVQLVPFNLLVFYLYYVSHATNPLIYCFMNQNFRDDLRKIFCRGGGRSGAAGGVTGRRDVVSLASTGWQR